jgi:endogenous inhibitor of DNA gyrase (YacG/DUF329 family)
VSQYCPICHRKPAPDTHPFCSRRCADIDLGRWFSEQYVVPGRDGEAAERPLDQGEAVE